jgi:hypothetical protein
MSALRPNRTTDLVSRVTDSLHIHGGEQPGQGAKNRLRTATNQRLGTLVELRVIGAPDAAEQAAARLAELLDLDRASGPRPSRKTPGLVLYYLTGRLWCPTGTPAVPRRRRAAR